MSNRNFTVFSKSLFGYKRSDVNEYIRNTDQLHSDEMAKINSEKDSLEERLRIAEKKIADLESLLEKERESSKDKLKNVALDYEKKLSDLMNAQSAVKDRLNESENRASSYLKLADSSSVRAESAEAELSVVSAALEDSKNEISELHRKLSEKDKEIKRISEFESLAKKMIANNINSTEKSKKKISIFKHPLFNRSKNLK